MEIDLSKFKEKNAIKKNQKEEVRHCFSEES